MPEHNMIDGKLSRDDLAYLSSTLDKMNMRKNWEIMFSVPSLRNLRYFPKRCQRNPYRLSELNEVVMSLQTSVSLLDLLTRWRKDSKSACIMYMIIHKNLPNSARKILMLMFLKENKNILASVNIENRENKRAFG